MHMSSPLSTITARESRCSTETEIDCDIKCEILSMVLSLCVLDGLGAKGRSLFGNQQSDDQAKKSQDGAEDFNDENLDKPILKWLV